VEDLILGNEALAAGLVTRQMLRTRYIKVHQNVYARMGLELDAADRARAAWLWSRREATLVGTSAAAIHGTLWLPIDAPAELSRTRRPAPRGIVVHSGIIPDDEICLRASIYCTTPARTAYDIGRRVPRDASIIRIDALLNATRCAVADVSRIADRYPGARGIRRLRTTLDLVDGGAESPQETRLRLLLVRSLATRPVTQIRVGYRRIDMGWPTWKVGVEYDGEQHWTDPDRYAEDIERLEFLAAQGWLIVRVSGRQLRYQPETVVRRVREVLISRGWQPGAT
jgi:very-short-patch-repair endonuclease